MSVHAHLNEAGDLVVETPVYRLLFARKLGYAVREVMITAGGAQRLDRFDRPGEGSHPTCMCFENLTVNNAFQQGHYGKENALVSAQALETTGDAATVELSGGLVPINKEAAGEVHFRKLVVFSRDSYRVELSVEPPPGPLSYIGAWWDVHDRWLSYMRSSAGVLLPLRPRYADSVGEALKAGFRTFAEMDRGEGVWMEMGGPLEAIRVRLLEPEDFGRVRGGMKFWDGPDEDESSRGVSHACINLDLHTDWAPADAGLTPDRPTYAYEVQFIPAVTYRASNERGPGAR